MIATPPAPAPSKPLPPAVGPAITASVGSRAARASMWVMAAYPMNMVLQLARNLVLTRLLFPGAFGLMALANLFLAGLQMCSDIGICESIVQHPDGDEEMFLQTAWTMQVWRSLLLWLAACALAYPVARFYAQPMLLQLIPVAAFANVALSLRSTSITRLRRHLRIGTMTMFEQSLAVAQFALIIGLAWLTHSVWSLVLAAVLGNTLYAAASHVVFPTIRHRFRWDKETARSLTRFGRWIFFSSVLTFLATQMDRLTLGKLIDVQSLGVYTTAFVLAQLPRDVVNRLSQMVLFPALSETARTEPHLLDQKVRKSRSLLLLVSLLCLTGIALIGPSFFNMLYDPRYADAGRIAQWLVIPIWFGILQNSAGYVLLAMGETFWLAAMRAVTVVASTGLAIWFNHVWGLPGFIVGIGLGTVAGQVVLYLPLIRRGVNCAGQDAGYTALGLAIIPAIVYPMHLVHARVSARAAVAADAGAAMLVFVPFLVYGYYRVLPQYPQLARFRLRRRRRPSSAGIQGVVST